jgi:hypothetical protein
MFDSVTYFSEEEDPTAVSANFSEVTLTLAFGAVPSAVMLAEDVETTALSATVRIVKTLPAVVGTNVTVMEQEV